MKEVFSCDTICWCTSPQLRNVWPWHP